jgi:hypothetical protein
MSSSCDDEIEYLEKIQKQIKNFENPDNIEVKVIVDQKTRDDFYVKMQKMPPREILRIFDNLGDKIDSNYNLGRVDEKRVKYQINRLKKNEEELKKKINFFLKKQN